MFEPEKLEELKCRIGFSVDELSLWEEIIEKMYFPYDESRQIHPMDDGFMMRKTWDEECSTCPGINSGEFHDFAEIKKAKTEYELNYPIRKSDFQGE